VTEQEMQIAMARMLREQEQQQQPQTGGGMPPGGMQMMSQFTGGGGAAGGGAAGGGAAGGAGGAGGGGAGGMMAGAAPAAGLAAVIALHEGYQKKQGNRPDSEKRWLKEALTGEGMASDMKRYGDKMGGTGGKMLEFMGKAGSPWEWF